MAPRIQMREAAEIHRQAAVLKLAVTQIDPRAVAANRIRAIPIRSS